MVLFGINREDTKANITPVIKKILSMKLFDDKDGKPWKESISSANHELLLVSQFTLEAYFKGAKPDFHKSMGGDKAVDLFDFAVEEAKKLHPGGGDMIKTGSFGANMQVALVNDGPVTILYEYPDPSKSEQGKKDQAKNIEKEKKRQQREENSKKKQEKKQAEKLTDENSTKLENLTVTDN